MKRSDLIIELTVIIPWMIFLFIQRYLNEITHGQLIIGIIVLLVYGKISLIERNTRKKN